MTSPQQFFATCAKGVEDLLLRECEQLGIATVQAQGGVAFSGELEHAYRLCLWSRLASRVLMQLASFKADDYDTLYREVQAIDWSAHMTATGCFAIDCFSSHDMLNNSHFATLRVKDAVVDQFSNNGAVRPDVERETPDIRINVYLSNQHCIVYLDLSGTPLHKRGYRQQAGEAPLKENLAAAILLRAKWPQCAAEKRSFADPMCGSGTLLIEAAAMALNRAPGLLRKYYGFLGWRQHDADLWQSLVTAAEQAQLPHDTLSEMVGCDQSARVIAIAQHNIDAAGFSGLISLHTINSLDAIPDIPASPGLLVSNPPYGVRMGDARELKALYFQIGRMLKHQFSGWEAAIFTADETLAKTIGLRAHHKNTLYNGALRCVLHHYHLHAAARSETSAQKDSPASVTAATTPAIVNRQRTADAQAFENRLRKNLKHLAKWARRRSVSCYRLYDADLPQYALAIDVYGKQVHVQEYEAPVDVDSHKAQARLHEAVEMVAEVLSLPDKAVVIKTRKKQSGNEQYLRQDETGRTRIVDEHGLKFIVNLHDYLDTGLFLDHRITRALIRKLAAGKRFLNLFAYTASASVYAAAGRALSTTTVDMSNTYLEWARDNMALNGFSAKQHEYERADCLQWLWDAFKAQRRFDLIFLDPPTFSNSKKMQNNFDVVRDHVTLLEHTLRILDENGLLIFSTNAKRFKLHVDALSECFVTDITLQTTDEDYRRRPLHRCWCISRRELTAQQQQVIRLASQDAVV